MRFLQPMYKPEPNGGTSSKKYLNVRVQMKKDTAANWEAANPVILAGEFIIVTTANGETRFKVGDGTKKYTQLPYTDEPLRSLVGEKLGKTEAAAKVQNKLNIFGQEYDGSAPITVDVIGDATTTQSGLMSAADKKTLGDITPLVVTFTLSVNSGQLTITSDKTFAQVKAANDSGKFIYGIVTDGTQIAGWFDGILAGENYYEFSSQTVVNEKTKSYLRVTKYTLHEDNIVTNSTFNLTTFDQVESIVSTKVTQPFENIDGIIKRENLNGTFVKAVPGTDYAAATHTHLISEVTNLETRLAALEAREIGTKVTLYRYVSA
nr:MAG TPA: hyaluronidase [Caudoviricetes sp.]